MKTVDVLSPIDALGDDVRIDMRRQRPLNQYAVDGGVMIEFVDQAKEVRL
jgi:hypothetical protein